MVDAQSWSGIQGPHRPGGLGYLGKIRGPNTVRHVERALAEPDKSVVWIGNYVDRQLIDIWQLRSLRVTLPIVRVSGILYSLAGCCGLDYKRSTRYDARRRSVY